MSELISEQIEMAELEMGSAIEFLSSELAKIRTGKASPAMLGGLMVEYYGAPTPINQVANIGAADARTLTVQPWEKNSLGAIEKAIFEANLGLTPMNNGELIIINVPPLTEERRKEYVKRVKQLGEDAKVSVRHVRQKTMDAIKKEVKEGLPEDVGKRHEDTVQKMTDSAGKKIDSVVEAKSKDVMTL